jgi:hypothetical protein
MKSGSVSLRSNSHLLNALIRKFCVLHELVPAMLLEAHPPPYRLSDPARQQPAVQYRGLPPCTSTSLSSDESRAQNPSGSRASEEKSIDFIQRIERKWAEYDASQNVFKRWFFELSSWLVSAICMGAIVGIYLYLEHRPMSQVDELLTLTNILGKVASAALIMPISEALGQLKWNWFHKSNTMWDFEIFDKASRYTVPSPSECERYVNPFCSMNLGDL